MSDERDPVLEALFAESQQELSDDRFTNAVLARVEARRRRVLLGRLAIVVLLIAFELLLDAPLQHSLGALAEALNTPLFDTGAGWFSILLTPLNSLAGLVGLVLFAIHLLYRKLFY
jgi:hypothetical protein